MEQLVFGWVDYLLFTSLLGVSLLIGIYFGFCSKQDSVNEYLFGGKTMGYVPVATSILASLLSAITFLGVPAEVYLHGCHYFFTVFNTITTGFLTAYVFIPVFYELQISSTYEYLELRFSHATRRYASFLYVLSLTMYVPIVIYVPALAFSQVTGYNLHAITPVLCIVCITYTSMGGVKAVVWTDTIQFIFTLGGLGTVLFLGIHSAGGFANIWEISGKGGRLDIFDFNPSPFARNTFWGMAVGTLFSSISHGAVGQKFIQRYLSIKTKADINKAVLIKTIGTAVIDVICTFAGLVIYARYSDCDPINAKYVTRNDQIVPYYVMDITKGLPGISGVFLAGIISCALSAMSASINTLSGIIYEDFLERYLPDGPNKDARAANIMKGISVMLGLVSIGLIFAIEHLGTVLEMSYSFRGAADGPLLGFFLLGMFFPWAGPKGALTGASVGLLFIFWVVAGTKWHMLHAKQTPQLSSTLPLSTDGCPMNESVGIAVTTAQPDDFHEVEDEPMLLFQITFLYYSLFGALITVIVGLLTSYLVGEAADADKVDPQHLTPIVRRFFTKKYTEVPLKDISQNKSVHK